MAEDALPQHGEEPPCTVAGLFAALGELSPDTLVVVGNDGGVDQPLIREAHVRLDADGRPDHLCTPETPGAVKVVLL